MIYDLFYLLILLAFSVCMCLAGRSTEAADISKCASKVAEAQLLEGQKLYRILIWSMTILVFLILLVMGIRT